MKIIFLDIDGVLNSCGSVIALGMSRVGEMKDTRLSPVSVGLIRWLLEQDESIHLYIHSTWSKYKTEEYFVQLFEYHGVRNPRVLKIFQGDILHRPRTERINHAVQQYNPDHYVVVDDIDLSQHFGDKMIHVNGHIGFGYNNLAMICDRFGIQIPIVLL